MERIGSVQSKEITPVGPPRPEIPEKVEGWEWSESDQEWEPVPMPTKTIAVGEVRPPEPTYYPAHPGVGEVLGWKFDFVGESWEPVAMPVKLVVVEEERPPAPEFPPGPEVTESKDGLYWSKPEPVMMSPAFSTYLLGPDYWCYGKHVGTSVRGKPYYSCCGEIGTDYCIHKRGPYGSDYDVIDFPDGFIEEGEAWGKFRKYTWTQWDIEYVGFLIRVNDGLFMIKTTDFDPGAPPFPVYMMHESEWCTNFQYYL